MAVAPNLTAFADATASQLLAWKTAEAYRQVFAGPAGERVLRDLMRFTLQNRDLAVAGDPHMTAVNVGRHRVGQRIAAMLALRPEDVFRITRQTEEEP